MGYSALHKINESRSWNKHMGSGALMRDFSKKVSKNLKFDIGFCIQRYSAYQCGKCHVSNVKVGFCHEYIVFIVFYQENKIFCLSKESRIKGTSHAIFVILVTELCEKCVIRSSENNWII